MKQPPPRVASARPRLIWFCLALTATTLPGCSQESPAPPQPRAVNAVRVVMGARSAETAYSGDVRPRYESALGFRVSGKLVARLVDVGDTVEKGALLARLDPADQRLNAEAARSQFAAARADYEQAKADLARYAELLEKKFISQAEFDRRRTAYEVASARLEQARAQLSVTRNQAAYTELRADQAGVITAIEAEVGQVVAAGQVVARLAQTSEKEIEINVPENRLADLSSAAQIDITLWAVPGRTYRGRVREISPSADAVTRTYAARITVLDADATMKLGMTANVFLRGVGRSAAVELPASAVFKQGERVAVWVIDPVSKRVRAVAVEIGGYHEDRVSILSGLKDGELVVRAGVHKLFEGESVRVLDEGDV
ncbi:MAG TPA: efflux RND transporter periplasmic adaptor subunit [Burkholderiales bacterium]|jgi:RND family efflux transporter MFP subunit|nr:efflux RND transporter periplasmic adaptor subunit [Burkholderiales bacterium]